MKDALGHGSNPRGAEDRQAASLLAHHPTKSSPVPVKGGMKYPGLTQQELDNRDAAWRSGLAMSRGDSEGAQRILREYNEKYPVSNAEQHDHGRAAESRQMSSALVKRMDAEGRLSDKPSLFKRLVSRVGRGL